jgi:AcrR family transcriptional regulator
MSKSDQTKKRIMQTYIQLIKKTHWDKITVKEICSTCNLTRGTFYQYFNDIYDLLEQIETPLLKELNTKFLFLDENPSRLHIPLESIENCLDCAPPKSLTLWFDFCKKNKEEIRVLLSSHGDPYFVTKLKSVLNKQIEHMMNSDYMPNDALRSHFKKAFLELHFLTVQTWLDKEEENFLSTDEILNILNTMRIGANYLSYINRKSID